MFDRDRDYGRSGSYRRYGDSESAIKITRSEEREISEKGTYGVDELKDMRYLDEDNGRKITITLNCLSKMQGYNGFSLEELRMIDYQNHFAKKINLTEYVEK